MNTPVKPPEVVDARVKTASDALGEALSKFVTQDILKLTHPNLQALLAAMATNASASPLANQQLLYAINDLQICMRALVELLIKANVITNEQWIEGRTAEIYQRVQYIKDGTPTIITS